MRTSLGVFMILAITALIMGGLVFGVGFDSLDLKNTKHHDSLEKYQL